MLTGIPLFVEPNAWDVPTQWCRVVWYANGSKGVRAGFVLTPASMERLRELVPDEAGYNHQSQGVMH